MRLMHWTIFLHFSGIFFSFWAGPWCAYSPLSRCKGKSDVYNARHFCFLLKRVATTYVPVTLGWWALMDARLNVCSFSSPLPYHLYSIAMLVGSISVSKIQLHWHHCMGCLELWTRLLKQRNQLRDLVIQVGATSLTQITLGAKACTVFSSSSIGSFLYFCIFIFRRTGDGLV